MDDAGRARLERARRRLDRLALYPQPLRLDRVRVLTLPFLFSLPRLRRYRGYALWRTILLRRPLAESSDDLLTHELCHVWQAQNRPLHVFWTWLTTSYEANPYEVEARRAVADTRGS
jgi:hypothetical protein